MKFILEDKFSKQKLSQAEAVLFPVRVKAGRVEKMSGFSEKLSAADKKVLANFLKKASKKEGDSELLHLSGESPALFVVFINDLKKSDFILLLRRFVRNMKVRGPKVLAVNLPDFVSEILPAEELVFIISEQALLAHYDFGEFHKTPPKEGFKKIEKVLLFCQSVDRVVKDALKRGVVMGEAVNRARTISNYPGGDMTPEGLAEAARELAMRNLNLAVTVFDEQKMKLIGMNAILAVGKGSVNPPRLIIIEYSGGKSGLAPLALVGKGITFDSGGLNIKPADGMADMHLDMSGGAAVISAMGAIADLKLPINVMGIIAAAENMPSGLSYRQGDIIKSYGGKTIEIGNTDAEGRVVLADAIDYAKTKKPALIVTLATLTGASMVALGTRRSALFVKNNKSLQDIMQKLGDESGDVVWPLPLFSENEQDVLGIFADVTNTSKNHSRYGGASTGAAFLSHFAGEYPFVHIDMAPRMLANTEEDQLSQGSVGFGVRFFVELAKGWMEISGKLK